MDNIIGVANPYELIQQAGKRRRRKTYRKKRTMRSKNRSRTRKYRK
jgi:hypothetical protein